MAPHPTFWAPGTARVSSSDVLANKPFRDRLYDWASGLKNETPPSYAMPFILIPFYLTKMFAIYLGMYWWLVMDPLESVWAEKNVKRFIVYTMLGDAVGFNSTCGALGFRSLTGGFFFPLYNFLTPGTITAPLLPGIPARRPIWLVVAYLVYIAMLVRALVAPDAIGAYEALPAVAALAVITPFDFIITEASRCEHYGYMLFCLAFPGNQWIFGCQCVQIALWCGAGTSKLGPWFKYVIANMYCNCPLSSLTPTMVKKLHRNFPTDMNPSTLCYVIATFGCISEISMGWVCAYEPTRLAGVVLTIGFHTYISLQMPFASVQEWNVFCILSSFFFFGHNQYSCPADLHPALAVFLVVFLVFIPLFGQLAPSRIPFLFAYRPYAGNWFIGWHVVTKAGQAKLRKLKTAESVFSEETWPLVEGVPVVSWMLTKETKEFMGQFNQWGLIGQLVQFPHLRPLVPIVEKLEAMYGWKSADDYRVFFHMQFLAMVHGWNLATGWNIRANAPYYAELQQQCQFKKGECFMVVHPPVSLVDHTVEWYVIDVADPSTYGGDGVIRGSAPYAELEAFQPIGMDVSHLEQWSRTANKKTT